MGNIDGPDANLDIDGKANADIPDADVKIKSPDMDIGADADVKLPDVDVKSPDVDVDVKSPDADINLPKGDASAGLDFGLKGRKGSHSSTSSSDSDDGGKKKKKKDKKGSFGFGIKMPKLHGPSFGGGAKDDVNLDGPDTNLDIDGKAKLDADIPNADATLSTPDVGVNAGADTDVKLPDVDVKSPDVD